jgi:hypothetical protein
VPHFSRFLREVGLLMFIRHRQSFVLRSRIRHALGLKRFYSNVRSEHKRVEKLRYHRNPVRRGLVEEPEQWRWISFRPR